MEGLLIYNGTGDHDEWYHTRMTSLDKPDGPMADTSKPHFKVGGPKLLIKW